MGEVKQVDFGKERNETAQRFARLLGIVQERHEDIYRRPEHYLQLAYDELYMLRAKIKLAQDALRAPVLTYESETKPQYERLETINVPLEEYRRLQRCAATVEVMLED